MPIDGQKGKRDVAKADAVAEGPKGPAKGPAVAQADEREH